MLILARRKLEKIMIGDDVVITITNIDCRHQVVKLGIDAPESILIEREEVYIRRKSGWVIPKYLDEDDAKCQLRHNTK